MLVFVAQSQEDRWSPKKGAFHTEGGRAWCSSGAEPCQAYTKPWVPSQAPQKEKRKSVTNEGSNILDAWVALGDSLTAGKAHRNPTQSSLVILKMSS